MRSVNQFAYISGTTEYKFGHNSIPNIPITDAPNDTDFTRWAMLYDGSTYRMYFFKESTNNKIYQFGFNGSSYQFGYNSIPELTLVDIPVDADVSSFAMLHDGNDYRLYLRQLGEANLLYQFAWVPGTSTYKWGHNSIPKIPVTGFPKNADNNRWAMLHDGDAYRFYRMGLGNNDKLLQGSFNRSTNAYEYAFNSIPELTLVGTPSDSDLSEAAMLHDGNNYRFYLLKK